MSEFSDEMYKLTSYYDTLTDDKARELWKIARTRSFIAQFSKGPYRSDNFLPEYEEVPWWRTRKGLYRINYAIALFNLFTVATFVYIGLI